MPACCEAAAQALVARHASLRAGFRHESLSRAVQVIVPASVAAPWRSLDLSELDGAERERRLAEMLAQDRAERFDLSCPPLLRLCADPACRRRSIGWCSATITC